jgi:hypothetical protein
MRRTLIVGLIGGLPVLALGDGGPQPLFNGRNLDGWEGNLKVWKVENGMIVGDSPGLPNNEFLATTKSYGDFELRVTFRLLGGSGNSGIQFRSARIPNHHEMIGYQADIGENYWGCLYDESRRNRVLVRPPDELFKVLNKDGWNEYVVRCRGEHIEMNLNGVKVVEYVENDKEIARTGLIALQVHSSKEPMRVEFKDITLREFSESASAGGEFCGTRPIRRHVFRLRDRLGRNR